MVMGAPIYTLFIMEQVDPETRARVNGWATMLWNFCYAVSSWVSGMVQKTWGFDPIFLAAGALYVGCILTQYFLFTPLERSNRRETSSLGGSSKVRPCEDEREGQHS